MYGLAVDQISRCISANRYLSDTVAYKIYDAGVFHSLQLLAELHTVHRMDRAHVAVATCIKSPRVHLKLSLRHLAAIPEQC